MTVDKGIVDNSDTRFSSSEEEMGGRSQQALADLSPGFRSAAAMAGWDDEALFLAAACDGHGDDLQVDSTPDKPHRKREVRTPGQAITPASANRVHRKPRRPTSDPAFERLSIAETTTISEGGGSQMINLQKLIDKVAQSSTTVQNEEEGFLISGGSQRSNLQRQIDKAAENSESVQNENDVVIRGNTSQVMDKGKVHSQANVVITSGNASQVNNWSQESTSTNGGNNARGELDPCGATLSPTKKEIVEVLQGTIEKSKPPYLDQLRDELTCAVCLEICFEPSTTSCGHSFCRSCLHSAVKKCGLRCPKCRKVLKEEGAINIVLWNTIQILFPEETAKRLENSKNEQSEDAPVPSSGPTTRSGRQLSVDRNRPIGNFRRYTQSYRASQRPHNVVREDYNGSVESRRRQQQEEVDANLATRLQQAELMNSSSTDIANFHRLLRCLDRRFQDGLRGIHSR